RLWHPEPGLAGGEGDGNVRRSETGRKAAERAIGGAVRVGADHDAARTDEPLLHHELVADTLLEDVGDAEFFGKVANDLVEAGRCHSVGRKDMVENHDD